MSTYRDLVVWQKSVDLAALCYQITSEFPSTEKYGLTSQIRRAATSIPANIAEGYGRYHKGDYSRFLTIAHGSLTELETHLILAVRLQLLDKSASVNPWKLCQEVGKMLNALIRKLQPLESKS